MSGTSFHLSTAARLLAILGVCVAGLSSAGPARAQEPFESARVRLALADQVNRNTLNDSWNVPIGGEVMLSTPFYAGEVSVGMQLMSNIGRTGVVPDYTSQFWSLGLGTGVQLPAGFRLEGGLKVGLVQMRFDHDDTSPAQLVEREVRLDAVGGIHYVLGNWRLETTAGYGTLFLSEPQRYVVFSVGVSRTFGLPSWVRRVLA